MPCERTDYAIVERTRDGQGDVVAERYLDVWGKPSQDADYRVFERRFARDAVGRVIRSSCWDADRGPVECDGTGFHADITVFDDAGREMETRFEGTDGRPATNMGTARRQMAYDSFDHLVESRSFGPNDAAPPSFSLRKDLYDPGHRLFAVLLYREDGSPAAYSGCYVGVTCPGEPWHAARIVRAQNGRVTEVWFFDGYRQRIETVDCTLNKCWD